MKFYGWKLVAALWLILMINAGFPYYGGSVINSYMATQMELDRKTLGLAFTLFTLFMGLPGPLVAYSVNRWGSRATLAGGATILILACLILALFVQTAMQAVFAFGVLAGTGFAFGGPIATQSCVAFWFKRRQGLAMSLVLTAGAIGGFIAAPLVDYIITFSDGNWRAGWWFIAASAAVSLVISLLFVRNRPADIGQTIDGLSEEELEKIENGTTHSAPARVYMTPADWKTGDAMKSVALWLIVLCTVIYTGVIFVFFAHGVIHLRDLGHSSSMAAFALGVVTLSSLAGRLAAGFLCDYIEPRFLWSAGMAISTIGTLLAIRPLADLQVYACAVCMGFGFGAAFVSKFLMLRNYFGAKSYATLMGLLLPITTIASSSAPYLAGMAYDTLGSYSEAFLAFAILNFAGGLILIFLRPPSPARASKV